MVATEPRPKTRLRTTSRLRRVLASRVTVAVASASLLAGLAGSGLIFTQPRWLLSLLTRRAPEALYFVDTDRPVVALTIDDGPDARTTPEILRLLARYDARATFFLIGERVPGHEAVVERMVSEGHELGNHLARDEPSIRLSRSQFERTLLETDSTLSRFAPVRWARPASGWYNRAMLSTLAAHGYRCALGSIYPFDAQIPSSRFAAQYIVGRARPGAIIILHDGGERGVRTAAVLRTILPELKRRGLRLVTLTELVNGEGEGVGTGKPESGPAAETVRPDAEPGSNRSHSH